jgi:glycosyltransferase involved in cell wall biosynthesis
MRNIYLFFLLHVSVFANPSICLNMIVKNESHVIQRALNSVKHWIDYWVIVDTGSTDGTQQIVQECMKNIPGQLEERAWKNFAFNRNEALALAKDKSDYILFLDGDDWIEFDPDFKIPTLTDDAYSITWHHGGCSYIKPGLVKANAPWRWEGVLHEYLICERSYSQTYLAQIKYIYGGGWDAFERS